MNIVLSLSLRIWNVKIFPKLTLRLGLSNKMKHSIISRLCNIHLKVCDNGLVLRQEYFLCLDKNIHIFYRLALHLQVDGRSTKYEGLSENVTVITVVYFQ
jgi:hypothetical protein